MSAADTFVQVGTGQHGIDKDVLTNESAVEESFNNILGMVQLELSQQHSEDFKLDFEKDLLHKDYLGDFQKEEIYCDWSPTNISDNNWKNLFNPMPKSQGAEKAHPNSVFNKGVTLSFERISGDTCFAFRRTAGGTRQLIRFGESLDLAENSRFQKRFSVDNWDSASDLDKVKAQIKTPISTDTYGNNGINQLWEFFCAKADAKGHREFFATAFMPIRDIKGKKILIVNEKGQLCFLNSNDEYKVLLHFYAEAYMYASSGLNAPVKHVRAFIQGEELNLKKTVWDKITAAPSRVFEIKDKEEKVIGAGQCKALTDKEIKDGINPGVRIALKNSTKFVNADPNFFFDDRMCNHRVQEGPETLAQKVDYYNLKGTNAQRKIQFGNSKYYLNPLEYMDYQPASYSAEDFNSFIDTAINLGDSNGGGKHLLSQALGFKTLSIIELKIDMQTNQQKDLFMKQPSDNDVYYKYVATALGAIYRAITEITFEEARKTLQDLQIARQPRSPPGAGAMVVHVEAGEREIRPRSRREYGQVAGTMVVHDAVHAGEGRTSTQSRGVQKKTKTKKKNREAVLSRLDKELKRKMTKKEYHDTFAPIMQELKDLMP